MQGCHKELKWNCRVNAKLNEKNSGREIGSIIISFSFSQANLTLGINCESRPIYISEVWGTNIFSTPFIRKKEREKKNKNRKINKPFYHSPNRNKLKIKISQEKKIKINVTYKFRAL